MSLAPVSTSVPAAPYPDHWITPDEQLQRLTFLPIAQQISNIPCEGRKLGPDVASIVVQYLYSPPQSVTNWHTALTRLNALPGKVPPLPEDIHNIMNGSCPFWEGKRVKDTHILVLIPQAFGGLDKLVSDILTPYGEKNYPEGEHPLRFRYFWPDARREHADTPFETTHWVLMTKALLPDSNGKTWGEHAALVERVLNYAIPTLQQSVVAVMLHEVATQERLYSDTSTHALEQTDGRHLLVGRFGSCGLRVSLPVQIRGMELRGVAALRKF